MSYFALFCLNKLHKDDSYNMAKVPTKGMLKCPKILEGSLKYNIRKNNVLVASVNLGHPGRSRMSLGKGGFFFLRTLGFPFADKYGRTCELSNYLELRKRSPIPILVPVKWKQ